jgi:hypothetical protein
MEKRLQAVEDVEQIKQLHVRYVNALTFINWDDVADCFADESSIDVQFGGLIKGKMEIARFFREMLSQIHIGKRASSQFIPRLLSMVIRQKVIGL